MKNKIASIILALSFVFAAMQMPVAVAEDTTGIAAREDLLIQLITLPSGVTAGSASVTRGLFAQSLALLLGERFEASPTLQNSSFYDVTGYDIMTQSIIFLENKGIVTGDVNKYFNPEVNIKSQEAVKMLICALGYKPLAESSGGYPDGYMTVASNIGLLKNTKIASEEDLTGEQLVNLFYNALDTYIASVDSVANGKISISTKTETLLTGILNMGHKKGTITQTPYTGLYTSEGCVKGMVSIDGEGYMYTNSSIIDYLGYNVELYYTDDKGEKTIVAYQVSKKNEVLVLDAEQIIDFYDYTLVYENENSSKTVSKKLDKTIAVIYNGKFTESYTKEMIDIDMGTVTLIANSSGNYDVMIIDDYIDYVAAAIDSTNKKIYTRVRESSENNQDSIFDLWEEDVDYKICDARGIDLELNEIAGNSILSIATSLDGKYVKIIVSTNVVSGTIQSIVSDDYNKPLWVINDEEYPVSRGFFQTPPATGSGIKAFLNYKGKIAYYLMQSDKDGWLTGYVIKIYQDESDSYAAKILKSDNLVTDYTFAEKIRVNGDPYTKMALHLSSELFTDDGSKRQIIRFGTNGSGEISKIQTALEEGSQKSSLRATTKASRLYRSGTQSFGFETFLNSKSYIFVVPDEKTPYVPGANTNFKVVNSSYFADQSTLTVQAYTVGDNMTEAYALVATRDVTAPASSIGDYITPSVVTKISEEVNENDEIVTSFTVQAGGTIATYAVVKEALDKVMREGVTDAHKIEAGDAIRYLRNSEGEINLIQLIYDASEKKYNKPNSATINNSYGAIYSFVSGVAERRGSDNPNRVFINVSTDENTVSLRIVPVEKFSVMVVDMTNRRPVVSTGNGSDFIRTKDIFGSDHASRVVYTTNAGTPTRMIIYNY